MRAVALLLAVGLAACAPVADQRSPAEALVGLSELELVQRLGPPERSYDVGDARFLAWTFSRRVVFPGSGGPWPDRSVFLGIPRVGPRYGAAPTVVDYACTVTVELGRVEPPPAWRGKRPEPAYTARTARLEGNGC